jgi:hypothetical protein
MLNISTSGLPTCPLPNLPAQTHFTPVHFSLDSFIALLTTSLRKLFLQSLIWIRSVVNFIHAAGYFVICGESPAPHDFFDHLANIPTWKRSVHRLVCAILLYLLLSIIVDLLVVGLQIMYTSSMTTLRRRPTVGHPRNRALSISPFRAPVTSSPLSGKDDRKAKINPLTYGRIEQVRDMD